ncbi:unnamed protein product [Porites evermanni]|uniref:Uncharacterized protein n=1 Tax=Porites evermanni TaxID=104178 RepID=A0ABN8S2R6_9CNID|nr:unnamed protein product [Porites evermanni]
MGRVRHVRSGCEVQVLTPAKMVSVDGFDQETKTIYEFYGCHFHGCPRCLPRNRDVRRNCHKDRTVNEVYDATEREAAMLRQAGYQVIEKWECDFNQDKKTDPQLKSFLQDLEMDAAWDLGHSGVAKSGRAGISDQKKSTRCGIAAKRTEGLLADYVNTWLKIKQESAGWPDDCRTQEQKDAYNPAYEQKEGITLEHVAKNPGRKTLLGQIRRETKQAANTCHSKRPSVLCYPQRPLLPYRSHPIRDDPSQRGSGKEPEDQCIYSHFDDGPCSSKTF